jgi:hypothetical protein
MLILITQTIEEQWKKNYKEVNVVLVFFRILLIKKEKKFRKLSLNSKLFRTDEDFGNLKMN